MKAKLSVVGGPEQGRVFEVEEGQTLVIGRGEQSNTQIADVNMSRAHCQIACNGGKFVLKDLGGAGGVSVFGEKIAERELKFGDVFKAGQSEFRLDSPTGANVAQQGTILGTPAPKSSTKLAKPAVAVPNSLAGTTLGRFAVKEVVAVGASSVIYKAIDSEGQKTVALKVLKPEFSQDEEEMARFVRGVKTAMGLTHPNIIGTFAAGRTGKYSWVAMELVEGASLTKLLREAGDRIFPWKSTLKVGIQIAQALEAAYASQIIHRNITPENILVSVSDRTCKLGDLMLAKALEGKLAKQITKAGEVVGDMSYAAPERLQSDPNIDCRSDIYGLGATLYALLTGRPPFKANNLPELLVKIARETPPDPRKAQPKMPAKFAEIVMKMLAKKPEERYQTPADLLVDLDQIGKKLKTPPKTFTAESPFLSAAAGTPLASTANYREEPEGSSLVPGIAGGVVAGMLFLAYRQFYILPNEEAKNTKPKKSAVAAVDGPKKTDSKDDLDEKPAPEPAIEKVEPVVPKAVAETKPEPTPIVEPLATTPSVDRPATKPMEVASIVPTPTIPALPERPAAPETKPAPAVPKPTPPVAAAPSNEPPQRRPIPKTTDQMRATDDLKSLYAEKFKSREPDVKKELAKLLLETAQTSGDKPAEQYALLVEARNLAVDANDAGLAMTAIDELGESFELDPIAKKVETIGELARAAKSPDDKQRVAETCLNIADEAIDRDEYAAAYDLANRAATLAKQTKEADFRTEVDGRLKQVRELRDAYQKVSAAFEAAKTDPADSEANLKVGSFLCFVKGDWASGLRRLEKSSDSALAELAKTDRGDPQEPAKQRELGDRWWDFAESQPTVVRPAIRQRAGAWYNRALPSLTGIEKAKAADRIEKSEAAGETSKSTAKSKSGGKPKAEIVFAADRSMRIAPIGHRGLNFMPPQDQNDPLGPFEGKHVYFQLNGQQGPNDIFYSIKSTKGIQQLAIRCTSLGLDVEIIDKKGAVVYKTTDQGGSEYRDLVIPIPAAVRKQFTLRFSARRSSWMCLMKIDIQ